MFGAFRVYVLYAFLSSVFFTIFATYNIVYYSTLLGLNPLQLVLVGTLLELTVFVFEVPTGIVADVYSRRLSIIVGVFLMGVGFTVEGVIPTFGAVLLSQIIWGIGVTFTSGATAAWITDELGEDRVGRAFMRGAQAGQFGGILGVLIGTALATVAINLPVLVGGLTHIALAVLLVFIMPETGFKPTPREDRTTWRQMAHTFRAGFKVVRVKPMLITLLFVGVFWGMASEGYDRLWQKHVLDNFTLPALDGIDPVAWFGIFSIAGAVVAILATELVRRRVDTTRPRALAKALLIVNGLLIGAVIVFAYAQPFALAFVVLMVIGTMRSLHGPLFATWLNQHIDSRVRATVLSMANQTDAIGQIAGGPVVGLIGLRLSVRAAIFAAGILLSPILVLYTRTLRRERAAEEAALLS